VPPSIAKNADENGSGHDISRVRKQTEKIGPKCRNIVDRPFDDSWNKKLKKIHNDQTNDAKKNPNAIFPKIWLYQR
jgi:hypothetical protein